jgi:fluoroacetyl-CoA thioesterase
MPEQADKIHETKFVVTDQEAIHFLGPDVPPVLSTPSLINMMELTSRENVRELLNDGEDTLGVSVNIKHLAATPVGMKVRVVSRLVKVDGRIYNFDLEAFDEFDKIGEGTHQRASVLVAKFSSRIQAKKEKSAHAGPE